VLLRIELLELCRARMDDAQLLFRNGRDDAAAYLCGYAVEFALKARICKHLKWPGYPATDAEFKGKRDFKTHDFDCLLEFTGLAPKVRNNCNAEWYTVTDWSTELRYRPIGSTTHQHAQALLEASKVLLKKLR
jgi:hypothetical protein